MNIEMKRQKKGIGTLGSVEGKSQSRIKGTNKEFVGMRRMTVGDEKEGRFARARERADVP